MRDPLDETDELPGGTAQTANRSEADGTGERPGTGQPSSRTIKAAIEPVDPEEVLSGVESLTVSRWEYESRRGVTHMGPMAEEFIETFGLGDDPRRIHSVDADGVALAAIQGLAARTAAIRTELDATRSQLAAAREAIDRRDERVAERRERIGELERALERRDERIDEQSTRIEELERRLAALESRLDASDATTSTTEESR